MRARVGLVAALLLLVAAGSGASALRPKPKPPAKSKAAVQASDRKAGAALWTVNGCAACHALAAAHATGSAGPNLDVLGLPAAEIARWLTAGGRSMPSFAATLTKKQIDQLALYVSSSARNGTKRPRDARSLYQGYCGACHVLAAARATGTIGPSLDGKAYAAAAVIASLAGGHTPSVAVGLSAGEIARVAQYVAASATPAGG